MPSTADDSMGELPRARPFVTVCEMLEPGDRVRVKGDWNWPRDCSGVVAEPPPAVRAMADQHPWRGHLRSVPGRTGPIVYVWVVFDAPQKDGDGYGPYRGGEVELALVSKLDQP